MKKCYTQLLLTGGGFEIGHKFKQDPDAAYIRKVCVNCSYVDYTRPVQKMFGGF